MRARGRLLRPGGGAAASAAAGAAPRRKMRAQYTPPRAMCIDFGIFSSGCDSSTSASVTSTATLSAISSVLSTNSTTVGQTFSASQVFTVDLTGAVIGPNAVVNISQSLNATVKFVASASTQVTSQIISSLQAVMQNNLDNMSKSQTELFGKALNGTTTSQVSTTVGQALESSQMINSISEVMQNFDIAQSLTIPMKGAVINGVLNFSQNSIIDLQASAIAGVVADVLASNAALASIASALKNSSSEKSAGLAGVLSAVGAIFTGPFKWIAIIVLICIVGGAMLLALRAATRHAPPRAPYSILQDARAS